MNLNRTSLSNKSAFYTSPIQKAEGWEARTSARLARGKSSKHFQVCLGFVPCRNALVSKPSGAVESNDITAELPGAGASDLSLRQASQNGRARNSINSLIHGSCNSPSTEGTPSCDVT
jgi:hypothetical protein